MTNGGFECTTTLISMGEAINTVKMSSNVNNRASAIVADPTAPSTYAYDDYENVLLSLKAEVDSKSYDYLNNNKGYQKVLLTDSRDVFFQNNPFNFLYKKNLNFFL